MNIADRIEAGAALLERSSWWRGTGTAFGDEGTMGQCIITAISGTTFGSRYLRAAITDLTGLDVGEVTFNDHYAQSKAQCVEVMRYAAKLAREDQP